ncbi:EAL domain-containing protein [Marinomonas arenicola]|uniref:EAL domain-containing protein n=1 Tax=Marinomonas arenicola TaxID=569601 RepID=A0ABU9G5X4_9GAMM
MNKKIFDHLPIPCLSTDNTFQIFESNGAAKQIFGRYIESDGFSGVLKTITRLIVSDLSLFFAWVESDDVFKESIILDIQCANGIKKFSISHSRFSVEERVVLVFTFSPITHRVDSDFQIDLYRNVFERSNQSIYISDAEGKILFVNPSFTHFFGYSLQQVKKKKDHVLYHEDAQDKHLQALNKLIYDVEQVEERMTCITAFEDSLPIECSVNIVIIQDESSYKFLHFIEDITQQVSAEQNMKSVAFKDPLTGIENRHSFNLKFDEVFSEAQRLGEQLSLFFIDLDKFKYINDEYGHEYGDSLLIHVAERLKSSCKRSDFVARLGGDEFVILIQGDQIRTNLELIARRLLSELSKPFSLKELTYQCTCSIGIAQYPNDAMSQTDLLHAADSAMYLAKRSGRNDFSFYNYEVQKETSLKSHRLKEIEKAIKNDALVLYFQPVHNMITGDVLSFEALARYIDETGQCHLPSYFLPFIEDDPLLYKLAIYQIRELKRYIKVWKHHGVHLPISINLSSYQIKSDAVMAEFQLVAETSPDISRFIKIEVTETMLFEESNVAVKNLAKLTDLGYSLVLDDFGTGHSSIYSLKKIKFESVKVDKIFVDEINYPSRMKSDDKRFLNAIIAMLRNLNTNIVCEGVENSKQINYLTQRGCQVGQGFYYSEAIPRGKVLKYLGM